MVQIHITNYKLLIKWKQEKIKELQHQQQQHITHIFKKMVRKKKYNEKLKDKKINWKNARAQIFCMVFCKR